MIINPSAYMAELTKLLGFMSSWDRQAVLSEYAEKFETCDDPEALLAELGSPTRVAIALARDYVPSPAPEASAPAPDDTAPEAEPAAEAAEPAMPIPAPEETIPDEDVAPELPPAEEDAPAADDDGNIIAADMSAAPKLRRPVFGVIVSVILGVLIALPITIVLLLIGIPFFVSGLGIIAAAVFAMMHLIPPLGLFSDILLVLGCGLAAAALGLLLAAFGFWLSFSLVRLWLKKVTFPVGRRLCRKKEVPQT